MSFIYEINREVKKEIDNEMRILQTEEVEIKKSANIFIKKYNELLNKRIEQQIFGWRNLSWNEYISGSKPLSDTQKKKIETEIDDLKFRLSVSAIFSGVENKKTPQIFMVSNNNLEDCTPYGYAAIGSGADLATLQFEAFDFSPTKAKFFEMPILMYFAKKRAEKAHGVGEGTDLIHLWTFEGKLNTVEVVDGVKEKMDKFFVELKNAESKSITDLSMTFASELMGPEFLKNYTQNNTQ